jgi:TolA-binding protein
MNKTSRTRSNHFGSRPVASCVSAALCLMTITVTVIAHHYRAPADSVRFQGTPWRDYGVLPPMPKLLSTKTKEMTPGDSDDDRDDEPENEWSRFVKRIEKVWTDAGIAKSRGDLRGARKLFEEYAALTDNSRETAFYYYGVQDLQQRRNSAIDQLDALAALDHGSSAAAVRKYLEARAVYDADPASEKLKGALDAIASDRNLRDNAAYLRAAILLRASRDSEHYEIAAESFNALVGRYPKSEKREAAIFMAAVATMKQSKNVRIGPEYGETVQPCLECRDDAWRAARAAFLRVMREYPRGRYFNDARGWLAFLSHRVGDWAGALVEYYRLLGNTNVSVRLEAASSLRMVRYRAAESDMREVEARIGGEPAPALAYAYHEIYNYSRTLPFNPFGSATVSPKKREALERVTAFAARLMTRFPNAPNGGPFALRAAMGNLELGNNLQASRQARRALELRVKGEDRARALWVQAVADNQRGELAAARDAMKRFIVENPNHRLLGRARIYLAIVLEDMGDLGGALEQYLALDYHVDVAYYIDVLMTPDQLKEFIAQRPAGESRDELRYALGVRYLREGRLSEAREALSKVRTNWQSSTPSANEQGPTDSKEDAGGRGIHAAWVKRDLKTIDDLERLNAAVESARDDEAKAEALYQIASYQFQEIPLLYHNPATWKVDRYEALSYQDSVGRYRVPNEAQILWKHFQAYEPMAHALELYLEIAARYPATRAAPDALYSAAVCHERLAGRKGQLEEESSYWQETYSAGRHAGSRMVTESDLKAAYPDYHIPADSSGWEPATRTINGGPAWTPPPPPV